MVPRVVGLLVSTLSPTRWSVPRARSMMSRSRWPRSRLVTPPCEYRRCGGSGARETRQRWRSRLVLEAGGREWKVCEHCAEVLRTVLRTQGHEVRSRPAPAKKVKTRKTPRTPAQEAARARRRKAAKASRARAHSELLDEVRQRWPEFAPQDAKALRGVSKRLRALLEKRKAAEERAARTSVFDKPSPSQTRS